MVATGGHQGVFRASSFDDAFKMFVKRYNPKCFGILTKFEQDGEESYQATARLLDKFGIAYRCIGGFGIEYRYKEGGTDNE